MSSVLFEIKNAVGIIILNRPEKFNAFDRPMALIMQKLLDDCAASKEVRAVYITGNGKAFSAGQDIGELTGENAPCIETILSEHYNPIVRKIRNLAKPVVAAVNGVAAGAGANIALCCDIVVAARSAVFIQAFSRIGLIPDSGGTYQLPRLIGLARASAIMMLGDKVAAADAVNMGMIYKSFPDETFREDAMDLAIKLAGMPTRALAFTKQALNASCSNTFDQQLELEERLQFVAAHTHDYKEGVKAFLEKREAAFRGE